MTYAVSILTVFIAMLLTAASGNYLIPIIRRLQFGSSAYEDAPVWARRKNGVPTMGGAMILFGTASASAAGLILNSSLSARIGTEGDEKTALAVLIYIFICTGIGFYRDHSRFIRREKNIPLPIAVASMTAAAALLMLMLYYCGDYDRSVCIPFYGKSELGMMYYPVTLIFTLCTMGAVSFTADFTEDSFEGIGGTLTVLLAASWLYSFVTKGMNGMSVVTAAVSGSCMGFLLWNLPPAKIHMGKTGAMLAGSMAAAVGTVTHQHIILVLSALIFFVGAIGCAAKKLFHSSTGSLPLLHHLTQKGHSPKRLLIIYAAAAVFLGFAANILSILT